MTHAAFIGLGNMGGPMAGNLVTSGAVVRGFDLSSDACEQSAKRGVSIVDSIAACVNDCDIVVSMLPAGQHVKAAYLDANGILANAKAGALLIDCSTIDVDTARLVAATAESAGAAMVDAPVSGGVVGAEAATLTFMVGGPDEAVARATPVLETMGKTIVHTGGPGNGQAAKICNNMLLGISMIGVSEAFVLGQKLGLDPQKLFDVSSKSSGQCWSLTTYCPVPGPVPTSPANRDYQPGFSVAMMLKDLQLAKAAAESVDCQSPLGAEAEQIYRFFATKGNEGLDFSAIIKMISGSDG